jgi:peptidoglycan/xylan/chitin deacetylase (PgdA/CDA1 family)
MIYPGKFNHNEPLLRPHKRKREFIQINHAFSPIKLLAAFAVLIFLASCTASSVVREDYEDMPPAPESPPPEQVDSEMDVLIKRVKQNGENVKKYFVLDEDSHIIVKAGFEDTPGFEVVYDLENAAQEEDSPLPGLRINFTLTQISAGLDRRDSFVWRPGAGGLLLSFDDAYMETWEQYFDLFEQYGARVTFFIQGDFSPFCDEAIRRGHDIGYHSLNHLDLRKQSREKFDEETILGAGSFLEAGVSLSAFAYPYGFSEPWMHEALLETYSVLRGYGVSFRLYDSSAISSAHIISKAVDNTIIKGEENFDRLIRIMLRTAGFLDMVLPLTSHDISDTAPWGITPRRLEHLLKTASELGLKFYVYRDFARAPNASPVTR